MNAIELLKKEHDDIERELLELETIMSEEQLNYPNLIHVLKTLFKLWEEHEIKEEKIFPILKQEKIIIPVKTMLWEHSQLRPHRTSIITALNSGNDSNIKTALDKSGKIIIERLRAHIKSEDEILYTIALSELTPEEINEMEKLASS